MRTLSGSTAYPFSQMVRDTIQAHGFEWAFEYYVRPGRLSAWEFSIFSGATFTYCEARAI